MQVMGDFIYCFSGRGYRLLFSKNGLCIHTHNATLLPLQRYTLLQAFLKPAAPTTAMGYMCVLHKSIFMKGDHSCIFMHIYRLMKCLIRSLSYIGIQTFWPEPHILAHEINDQKLNGYPCVCIWWVILVRSPLSFGSVWYKNGWHLLLPWLEGMNFPLVVSRPYAAIKQLCSMSMACRLADTVQALCITICCAGSLYFACSLIVNYSIVQQWTMPSILTYI